VAVPPITPVIWRAIRVNSQSARTDLDALGV
jgi:hypothetical protein